MSLLSSNLYIKMLSLWSPIHSLKGTDKKTQLDPKLFLTKLGNCCNSCGEKVSHSNSISICNCIEYGHLQCMKKYFDTLKLKQTDHLTCVACNKSFQITFQKCLKIGINAKVENYLFIILLCIMIAFLLTSIKQQYQLKSTERNLFIISFQMLLTILLLIALLVLAFMTVVYSQFKIKDIKKTKNQVIASAFYGILTHRDSQNSANVIFT